MGLDVINAINNHKTFKFDRESKRVVNTRFQEDTDIEEFLNIRHILDNNRIKYRFDKNFDIKIL
jgi:uncharacterized protein YkuJ